MFVVRHATPHRPEEVKGALQASPMTAGGSGTPRAKVDGTVPL
jgi:hypothetical protein